MISHKYHKGTIHKYHTQVIYVLYTSIPKNDITQISHMYYTQISHTGDIGTIHRYHKQVMQLPHRYHKNDITQYHRYKNKPNRYHIQMQIRVQYRDITGETRYHIQILSAIHRYPDNQAKRVQTHTKTHICTDRQTNKHTHIRFLALTNLLCSFRSDSLHVLVARV